MSAFSSLRLIFTSNHGSSAVCADGFVLRNQYGVQIPWGDLNPEVSDTGGWSSFPGTFDTGNNIRNDVSGQYCSERFSFDDGRATSEEILTFEFQDPIAFVSFDLQQSDEMGFNPKNWVLEGLVSSGSWTTLYEAVDFDFDSEGEIRTFNIASNNDGYCDIHIGMQNDFIFDVTE